MKTEIYTPQFISLIISCIILLVLSCVIFLISLFAPASVYLLIIGLVVVFGISYFTINFFIRRMLIHKISPLYKIIEKPESEESFEKSINLLKKANINVAQWAIQKNAEIDKLKRMEKFRREFLGNVSHELKTPLFSIQGYISTLLEGGLSDVNVNQKFLEKAEKNVNRMITIIKDLETISNIETGELQLNYEKFDVSVLVREMFEMLEIKANNKGIKFFLLSQTKNVLVYADRNRIADVLYNLLLNSINYGKENGKTSVYLHDLDERILIEVADNGIGIEEKNLSRLFERFYRVDKSRSRDEGGTGLGLAIVKHILEAHQQSIHVKSTFGVGSSFSFTLKKSG